jgi:hypothetical protein
MAEQTLDFRGIPAYQPNNLCIMTKGHIPQKAIKPLWPGLAMTGTADQLLPLGLIVQNGLGEDLMYAKYSGVSITGKQMLKVILPKVATVPDEVFTFAATSSQSITAAYNAISFYAFTSALCYGWIRLAHTARTRREPSTLKEVPTKKVNK